MLYDSNTTKRCLLRSLLRVVFCGILLLGFVATPSQAEARSKRIKVRKRDTLGKISKRTGCSVSRIKKENRLKSDLIKPGQRLRLPKGCKDADYKTNSSRYVVRAGDSMNRIAKRHGCKVKALRRANRKVKRDLIRPGQKLRLPKACRGEDSPAAEELREALEKRQLDIGDPIDVYKVVEGDTLGSVAKSKDCPVELIMRTNRLKFGEALEVGRALLIPPCMRIGGIKRSEAEVDSKVLAELMDARGFNKPRGFRALILEVSLDETNKKIIEERMFDYGGQSDRLSGWNPASTVKIFPVIGALLRTRALGFSLDAEATFYNRKQEIKTTIRDLVLKTLIESNNMTYNRLTQLASFDYLNGEVLTEHNGMTKSAIMKAYEYPRWIREGEVRSLRESPPIKLTEGAVEKALASRNGTVNTGCYSSACTTLRDLAEAMRRVMLQECLPMGETFGLHKEDLDLIRFAMSQKRRRGNQVVDIFKEIFSGANVQIYNKPGYSEGWFSDNVFIYDPDHHRAWVVVMAADRGRSSLNSATRVVGHILSTGELRAIE